jgi:hypothetical protein
MLDGVSDELSFAPDLYRGTAGAHLGREKHRNLSVMPGSQVTFAP